VEKGYTPQPSHSPLPLTLSPDARSAGIEFLYRGPKVSYLNQPLHEYLRRFVYDGHAFGAVFLWPLLAGAATLMCLLLFSVRKDVERLKQMKYGRRLKGPVLVLPEAFNRAVKGEGVGFKTIESKRLMRIPQSAEGQHIELMSDTGAFRIFLIARFWFHRSHTLGTYVLKASPLGSLDCTVLRMCSTIRSVDFHFIASFAGSIPNSASISRSASISSSRRRFNSIPSPS
jgi:hypothetical protein